MKKYKNIGENTSKKTLILTARDHMHNIMKDRKAVEELITAIILFFNGNWGQVPNDVKDFNDENSKEHKMIVVGHYPSALDTAIVKCFDPVYGLEEDGIYIMSFQDLLNIAGDECPEMRDIAILYNIMKYNENMSENL